MELVPFSEIDVEGLLNHPLPAKHWPFFEMDIEGLNNCRDLNRIIRFKRWYVFESPRNGTRHSYVTYMGLYGMRLRISAEFERYYRVHDAFYFSRRHNYVSKFAKPILLDLVYRDRHNHLFILPPHLMREIWTFLNDVTTIFTS